jgi:hypothetical protein
VQRERERCLSLLPPVVHGNSGVLATKSLFELLF